MKRNKEQIRQRSSARTSGMCATGLAIILFSAVQWCPASTGDSGRHFIWNEANSRMSSARSEADFLNAAESYNKLIRQGVRSAPLFYNTGTALIKAGLHDEALTSLLRAERYAGTTWEIKRNILLANSGNTPGMMIPLPWYRYPLFWHFGLPVKARTTIAVCSFALVWLAMTLRMIGLKKYKGIVAAGIIIFILFGSSSATTIHQEAAAPALNLTIHNAGVNP